MAIWDGSENPELRLYAITSKEVLAKMNGNRGKLAAQAGHAYLHAWWDAFDAKHPSATMYKNSQAAAKIALIVDTDAELQTLYSLFLVHDIKTQEFKYGLTKVTDAGRTVFKEPTLTFVGVGPISEKDFERIAGRRLDLLL